MISVETHEVPSTYGHGRAALVDAAIDAVAAHGLRKLTYRRVAAAAGVTHTLVAHHFGSLDTLLDEALQHSLRRSVSSVSTRPGSGDLDALFGGLAAFADDEAVDQAFQFEVALESRRRPELLSHVRAVYQGHVDAVHHELTVAGLDPDGALSHLVYAAAEGLVLNQITHGDRETTSRSLAHLRRLLAVSGA